MVQSYRKGQILHHPPHTTHIPSGVAISLASHQILDATIGVDFHGAQVVEPVNKPGLLAELLAEGVAKVVGRVGRDEQHGAAHLGQLDGKTA
jgi:hypothetical protein